MAKVGNEQQLEQAYQQQAGDPKKGKFELLNFVGRPYHDDASTSDSGRIHQREGKAYSMRYFQPDRDEGYTDVYRMEAKAVHAGGNVADDNTPFYSVFFDETLDDGTRRRCERVMSEDGVTVISEICSALDANGNAVDSAVICGIDLCALEARLTAAGV